MISRRNFITNSSLMVAGLGVAPHFSTAHTKIGNEKGSGKLNLGVIGCGMGYWVLLRAITNDRVHCVGLCDVDQARLDHCVKDIREKYPNQTKNLKAYTDFRVLLSNEDIHGVIIATPDHWHTYIFAEAVKAGKHVYIEKPVANSIGECNLLMDLQSKYKRVVTTGLWQTSDRYFRAANEILKSGVLGDVYKVKTWISRTTNPVPFTADSEAPESLDYDMWLGPSQAVPFNSTKKKSWRHYWAWGGGQQTDWGVHWIDSAFEGLKCLGLWNGEYPKSVFSSAHKHPDSFHETPSCQTSIIQYDNFHIEWAQQVFPQYNRALGVAWIGSKGTLVCNREGFEFIPEKDDKGRFLSDRAGLTGPEGNEGIFNHVDNWGDCILSNSLSTNSPIERGAFSTIVAHMANISYRIGRQVCYDPQLRQFNEDIEANNLLTPTYRAPWSFPKV